MGHILSITSLAAGLLLAQASQAGERPKVGTSHLELRGLKLGRHAARDLLEYLAKRLADGGTVDVQRYDPSSGRASQPVEADRPDHLLSGAVFKAGDTCLVSVQVIPVRLGLVTSATTDTTRCDQASLEASLEKSAQALRNVFLRPPEPQVVVAVERPKVKGVELAFEGQTGLAQHLSMALVERGVARAVPAPRERNILANKAKREAKQPPRLPVPDLKLGLSISKIGLGCLVELSTQNKTGRNLPARLSRRAECQPEALAGAVDGLAEELAGSLE